ncbi:4-alpha-glucanotransferase [Lachnospiraceae bacterium XBB1006]|nr:4-alpha-glucanotransferase [Lachnospiraceae bacterium XBB1006]
MRRCGVLMPVFSLASEYGIGCFSKEAYRFIEFCERTGIHVWQMLPIGPTSYGDSPYQSFSSFAMNPYFLDLEDLVSRDLLTVSECEEGLAGTDMQIQYEKQYRLRFQVLKKAFFRFMEHPYETYEAFKQTHAHWLMDYALYMAIKDARGGVSWREWEEPLAMREPKAIEEAKRTYKEAIEFHCFLQFFCYMEWETLHRYAKKYGVSLLGDIPIYVAYDSADVWSHKELFLLDEDGYPTVVAGCPPDAFSETGQLWGNPLYDWDKMKKDDYAWWMERIRHNFTLFDELRIDHFRGFSSYFAIPYGKENALEGQWCVGPGIDFFEKVKNKLGSLQIVAEDLGIITDDVRALLKACGYPGMKVLQFAFPVGKKSEYQPHRYEKNCVVYTGTHDNDTVRGWYQTLSEEAKQYVCDYLGRTVSEETVTWEMIRLAMASVADTCMIPIQDYCNLGTDARINIPSTVGGNWLWRIGKEQLTWELERQIKSMILLYER